MTISDHARLAAEAAEGPPARLARALARLGSTLSFMQTGAHPDDETSGLLALLAFRDGHRIAFACSTRGEGGQNSIGRQRGEDLAHVRTHEMAAAAAVLGMRLYWFSEGPDDSIRDFRFSKSAEETLRHWGHDRVLARMVRIIRQERPDCLCPTFLDVGGQHGHHRAMTRIAREAYECAGDPAAFPEQVAQGLAPWSTAKFYLPAWSGAGASYDDEAPPPPATTPFDIGAIDPVSGAPYARIGEWSRRLHASQNMGRWIEPAPMPRPLHLAASRVSAAGAAEQAVTDGLRATLGDWARHPAAPSVLREAAEAIEDARRAPAFSPQMIAALAEARGAVDAAAAALAPELRAALAHRLARKLEEIDAALAIAAGVAGALSYDAAVLIPGRPVAVHAALEGPVQDVSLVLPAGWQADPAGPSAWTLVPPADAPPDTGHPAGAPPAPGEAPALRLHLAAPSGEVAITLVPAPAPPVSAPVTLLLAPDAVMINRAIGSTASVSVTVRGLAEGTSARISAAPPPGFSFGGDLLLTASQPQGGIGVTAGAGSGGGHAVRFSLDGVPAWQEAVVETPHLGTLRRAAPAVLRLGSVDCAIAPGTRIAYCGGGADRVDHWLRQVGMDVVSIPDGALAAFDLAPFSTLLVGIFAAGMRADLAASWPRIHAFVRAGGTLVTLYHRPLDGWDPARVPLAPIEIGSPSVRFRVTDAAARVEALLPDHPLLNTPNRIGEADWAGWFKERCLYAARRWDAAYAAPLAMADPGEPPHHGTLLSGTFGRGRHTHVALALHTELDALTPGAFRLMANLVAPSG